MTFFEKNIDGMPVFELDGKIMGGSESLPLCNRLLELIKSGKINILLDLNKVKWINSAGVGMLIACVKKLREKGGDLHFAGLHGRVEYYFKISKIDTVLKIYKNQDDAIRIISSDKIHS